MTTSRWRKSSIRLSSVSIASGPKSRRPADRRKRIRLVDEEDAVERTADRAIGLDRRRPDVLADEAGAVDLDEMAALEEAERAVHLREQSCHRRLAGPRVAEEDEVLRRRHFGQPELAPPRLNLQERDECPHLLLHRREADERIELRLQLLDRTGRLRARQRVADDLERLRAGADGEPIAEQSQGVARPQKLSHVEVRRSGRDRRVRWKDAGRPDSPTIGPTEDAPARRRARPGGTTLNV